MHREAFVGSRRYDERSRFFRLTSLVRAMNLRVLRSLKVSWFICRNARFQTVVSPFLPRRDSDRSKCEICENGHELAPVVLSWVREMSRFNFYTRIIDNKRYTSFTSIRDRLREIYPKLINSVLYMIYFFVWLFDRILILGKIFRYIKNNNSIAIEIYNV